MVQPELHPPDEGRKVDGDSSQPHSDAAASGVPEAVTTPPPEDPLATPQPELLLSAERPPVSEALPVPPAVESAELPFRLTSEPQATAPPPGQVEQFRTNNSSIRLAQVKEELTAWIKTLFSAAVYAVLIVTFGFQVARVEGQSMAPTLEDQDRLIVNKLAYRIGEPRRGDIVMLYYPLNPEKSFVKRVIAEEGDTVRIVDGRVYVNDVPLQDDYVPEEFRSHDDWGPQVIPEGYDFVMGDHRNNSSDSRHWGMVPKKYIIGKVQVRWWPVPTARVF